MAQAHSLSLSELVPMVVEAWAKEEDHPKAAEVLGAGDNPVVVSCAANFDSQKRLVTLVASNNFTFTVTSPTPGPVTKTDSGTIFWQEVQPGIFPFQGNEGDGCYIILTGGAVPGWSAFRAGDRNGLDGQIGEGKWAPTT
ncbi:hypothetical protein FRC07_003384 [Ceratobasidium sp. 392]|nr:hypothetical protein FRC07_003384 [Ceratobasidium sp. 392]